MHVYIHVTVFLQSLALRCGILNVLTHFRRLWELSWRGCSCLYIDGWSIDWLIHNLTDWFSCRECDGWPSRGAWRRSDRNVAWNQDSWSAHQHLLLSVCLCCDFSRLWSCHFSLLSHPASVMSVSFSRLHFWLCMLRYTSLIPTSILTFVEALFHGQFWNVVVLLAELADLMRLIASILL